MSNVRPRGRDSMRIGRHSLRSALKGMPLPSPASFHSWQLSERSALVSLLCSSGSGTRRCVHAGSNGSFHSSGCGYRALGSFPLGQWVGGTSRRLNSRFVVGALRRSAAPGSQFVGAAEYGSRVLSLRCYPAAMRARSECRALQHMVQPPCARPNHSIERTSSGKLRLPPAAAHVKR